MGRPRGRPRKEPLTQPTSRLKVSPYPEYKSPLRIDGDALVLPDLEMPFHDAVFVNKVLDLSQAWGINQLVLAGDMLHFDSLSSWEPNWVESNGHGGLDERQEEMFVEFAKGLSSSQQAKAFQLLEEIGPKSEPGGPNVSEEMRVARKAVRALSDVFPHVYIICGNHEGRLLRAMQSPLFPAEILRLVDAQTWQIAPYYYSVLVSGGQKYRIEHPRSAAKGAAITLASKFQCHIFNGSLALPIIQLGSERIILCYTNGPCM